MKLTAVLTIFKVIQGTSTVDESDLDVYDNSMEDSVTGLEEDNYDYD